jgi:flavin-dependent dehydrogenase
MEEADALIIGAGPAGSACAKRLVQSGRRVILLDKYAFPRVKLCAGWVTPQVFRYLGVTPESYPYSLTRFRSFWVSIKGVSFTLPTKQYAIRRVEFDRWMLARTGADFRQHEVRGIRVSNGNYLIDDRFTAPILVGAGGTNCPVYRQIFQSLSPRSEDSLIVSLEEEFKYKAQDDRCHLWFFENGLSGYSWYVPKQGGYVNVGIGAHQSSLQANGTTLRSHWNLFINKLKKEKLILGHDFQPAGHSYYLRRKEQVNRFGNVFLVGDSLGLATRDMGEGIGPALRSGQLVAEAIINGNAYEVNSIPWHSIFSLICFGDVVFSK